MKGGLSDCAMSEEFWWLLIVLWLLDPSRMIGMAVGKALFVQFMEAAISARAIEREIQMEDLNSQRGDLSTSIAAARV